MGLAKLKALIAQIEKKPSTAPDRKTSEQAGHAPVPEKTSIKHDLINLDWKHKQTLGDGITTAIAGGPMDDKQLLLEKGVAMLQTLPANSRLGSVVANRFIEMLWNDLPHPSATLAGPAVKYRKHDGSGNNLWKPEMGAAGTPYSRSVPPLKPRGPNLPDPELVFEQLLKRDGPFRPHPSGLNRLFFSFATIVIHECFQTRREDQWINETSHYVDLSTLYGNTEKEQKTVRSHENGRLFPDSIASDRIMLMPPGVVALLVLFSRNHNHIAESLLSLDEAGQYGEWSELDKEKQTWQDEDIFQLARNINVGFFATVVLKDYVAAILNTPRANSTWSLDLGGEIKNGGTRLERGTGNVVSVEFAVLYHWHAALSAADDKWMEEVLRDSLPGLGSMDDVTVGDFHKVMKVQGAKLKSTLPQHWTFGGLERDENGKFNDFQLGELIKDAIEEPAHEFGAHGTPASLRVVDIMGQLQARNVFNVCSMNAFRRYLHLKPYESFEEWNPNEETARRARLLYGHIENLELYPGLMAEVTKPAMAGSGVCPGQTTGRGILDDAVALVRGDRFLSTDFNSSTLTDWGVSKVQQPVEGSYGGKLPALLFSCLPGAFTGTSSYALLPFYTPSAVKDIMKNNGVADQYDFQRPRSDRQLIGIHTQQGCKSVFEDRDDFRVMYQEAILKCTDGHEFMIGWDERKRHDERSKVLGKVFFEENFESNVSSYFRRNVSRLIGENSLKYAGTRRSIDIVRDVTNVTPILWLAERFAIPLKTVKDPRGLVTVPELFQIYLGLFIFQSFNILPENEWKLRAAVTEKAAPVLRQIHTINLQTQQGLKEKIVDWLTKDSPFEVGPDADRIYKALNATGLPTGDLVGDCIGMAAPVAGNLTQQASLLIDLYLSPGYEKYAARIAELAHDESPEAERELQGFVYEGMRHAGVVPGLPRVAARDVTVQDGVRGPIKVKAGQTVLVATSKAAMDPTAYPEPEKLDPTRPFSAYTLLGHGLHFCFGARLVGCSLAGTLREVFKLKNLRRAEGKAGKFALVEHEVAGVKMRHYLDSSAAESPIPTSLTLWYDE